jgi:hypothetical protein
MEFPVFSVTCAFAGGSYLRRVGLYLPQLGITIAVYISVRGLHELLQIAYQEAQR